jgi:outer membrane protein
MKKLIVVAFLVVMTISFAQAQTKTKLGYIDSNELLQIMPGRDSAKTVLEGYAKELENQIRSMYTEYQTKEQEFIANEKNYTELIKNTKRKDLLDLQQRIQDFQESAQTELQAKEQELLMPIIDKAKKAIEEVAKENGYTYVFDSGAGMLLYFEKTDDILPLVKKKIGIK